MNLFLNVASNKIISFDVEKRNGDDLELNVDSIELFEDELSKRSLEIDDELSDQISTLFDDTNDVENKFTIKHWVSNRSIGELIDMFDSGEIIKPTMQRNLVWDSIKCSRLIESVLMGLPIPPLFMIEVDNSKYELVDGLQRLSTFTNYIYGYTWSGNKNTKRPCKLSSHVMSNIAGKTFSELTDDQQRILRRSTIPLIEFKQLEPNNNDAKYLIFERINTGSVKLTPMQIRKSLAFGKFMESLYSLANTNFDYLSLFSNNNIKKDLHVEALLRIMVITEIYNNEYQTKESNIGKILNDYCEQRKETEISDKFIDDFNRAIELLINIFDDLNNVCRKVIVKDNEPVYSGSLQVTILESMVGTIIKHKINIAENIEDRYKKVMLETYEKFVNNMSFNKNPFNYSTGTKDSITRRYEICERILLVK